MKQLCFFFNIPEITLNDTFLWGEGKLCLIYLITKARVPAENISKLLRFILSYLLRMYMPYILNRIEVNLVRLNLI